MSIKTLILWGEGINCEQETKMAFEAAGSEVELVHLSDFLKLETLEAFDILAFPGGFSYGDEIRSGKILSEKIKQYQKENIKNFIKSGKPIIGICNGFQILTQLGAFNDNLKKDFTLSENQNQKFINKWCELKIIDHSSLWLKDLGESIELPIRHKEGRVQIEADSKFKIALTYNENLNGSFAQIAGITNEQGNVFALMPHPEAAINNLLRPNTNNKTNNEAPALQIFKNAVNFVKERQYAN